MFFLPPELTVSTVA